METAQRTGTMPEVVRATAKITWTAWSGWGIRWKKFNDVVTSYGYDPEGNLTEENYHTADGASTKQLHYVLGNEYIGLDHNYYLTDEQESVRYVLDAAGNV